MSASLRLLSHAVTLVPVESPRLCWTEIARQANYRPQRMATLCGVSFRTVQRHFRKHYSSTFTSWLEKHRMSEAHRRILEGDSVKEVCFDLGYQHPTQLPLCARQEVPCSESIARSALALQFIRGLHQNRVQLLLQSIHLAS